MKRGYHSTQRKIWGTIPASEFYGFVLGYALATICRGLFSLDMTLLPVLCGAIGVGIGIWADWKFYMEKDEETDPEDLGPEDLPAESVAGAQGEGEAGDPVPEGASMDRKLRKMFDGIRDEED